MTTQQDIRDEMQMLKARIAVLAAENRILRTELQHWKQAQRHTNDTVRVLAERIKK